LSLLLLLCGISPAFAQTTAVPHGALFGASDSRATRHELDLTFLLAEGHDTDTPSELRGVGGPDTLFGGYSTIFTSNADYRWERSRVHVAAAGASTLRYFNDLGELRSMSHTAAAGLTVRLASRTSASINQTAAYSPSYLYGLFPDESATNPGEAIPAAPDYAVNDFRSYSYSTSAALTHGLTRHSRVSALGNLQHTDFIQKTSTQPDLATQAIRGEFARDLARNTAIRVGYAYRTGTFGSFAAGASAADSASTSEHAVDLGLDCSRPLSATRQIVFGASIGSSAIKVPPFLLDATDAADTGRLYRASSDLSLRGEFKTWRIGGRYQRGWEYVAQLRQPVFLDGFAGDLTALITRRLDLAASARYSSGGSALLRDALTLDTYSADVRIRYALTRAFAAYGEYLYYFYDFNGLAQLAPGVPRRLERNGVRAGLTLWVPVFRR